MSLLMLIAAIRMLQDGTSPGTEYLVVWALFSIADAVWVRGGAR